MKLWTSLTGLIQAELLTADPAGALCAIADAGIALRDVTPEGELCLRFSVARPSYARLLRLSRKRGETLTILGRTGGWPQSAARSFPQPQGSAGQAPAGCR